MYPLFKSILLAIVFVSVFTLPAEAGLRDKLGGRRGGGGGECADGSCGRPIGLGLKKPGAEVGTVEGDGVFVKMYEAQPEQPIIQATPTEVADRPSVHPLVYLLACAPLALLLPALAGGGAYFVIRKAQEANDD